MQDANKTKEQLLEELTELRQKIFEPAHHKTEHLNRVLRAIRDIDQLIVTEKNSKRLLERATELLVQNRGYASALCIHLDDNQQPDIVAFYVAGGEEPQASMEAIRANGLTACMKQALETNEIIVLESDAPECRGCSRASCYYNKRRLARGLVHDGIACGVLIIALPEGMNPDAEELVLLEELSEDIAFALHGIRVSSLHAESQEEFRIITESSADAIFITDRDGRYTYVNDAASRLLGYTAEELTQLTIADITAKNQLEKTFAVFQELLAQGNVFVDLNLVRKDGTVIPVDLNAVILPNGEVYGSCRDQTERQQAHDEILTQLAELRSWHAVTLDREDRVQELKREVNALCRRLGEPIPYPSQEAEPPTPTAAESGP